MVSLLMIARESSSSSLLAQFVEICNCLEQQDTADSFVSMSKRN